MNFVLPSVPRYKFAKEVADNFLVDIKANALPFNPLEYLKSVNGIKVYTYQELAEAKNLTIHELGNLFGSFDGITMYHAKLNQYAIAYNENCCEGRINWTLAHELGHILLGHFKIIEENEITIKDLTDEDLKILDKEANAFTGEVLSPAIIMFFNKNFNAESIMNVCNLSYTAASYRANFLSKIERYYYSANSTEHKLLTQFGCL